MDNFNPIIITRRLMNNINLPLYNQNSAQAREAQNSAVFDPSKSASGQGKANPPPAQSSEQPLIYAIQNLRMELLGAEQKIMLLKNMLQLPPELKEFLQDSIKNELRQLLNKDPARAQYLTNLLNTQSSAIPVRFDAISQLLIQNSDVAMQKLMHAIANMSRAGATDITQFKELINIIGASVAALGADNSQAVKQLMLLYLPWLPLNASKGEHTDFNLEFLENEGEQGGGENIETVSILIRTQNYGNISAIVEMNKANKATVLFNCADDFPKEMFSKLFSERIKKEGIEAQTITQSVKQLEISKAEHHSVNITAQSGVSPNLLLAAYTLIRLVIEIDKNAPSEERKAEE